MAVPKFDMLMVPLLEVASDGKDHSLSDVVPTIADKLGLSEADRVEPIASGQSRLRNRIYWAKLYLSQSRAIETIRPGFFRITDRGQALLERKVGHITSELLMEFPEFRAFRAKTKSGSSSGPLIDATGDTAESSETPQESIEVAYRELKAAVVRELLDAVRAAPPTFLETLIVQLLIAMGYGSGDGSGIVLGGNNDGGVDGVVRKDRLGLSSVYIQAKRYKDGASVGAPAIQQLAGSMQERRADEGVFVTTSTFTREAYESVKRLHVRIALIDGQRLAELMFELGIGVTTESTLSLKRVDSDFFPSVE